MAAPRPFKLTPRPTGIAQVIQRRNMPTLALAAVALALAALIAHDILFPPGAAPAAIRTATVVLGTVTNSVSATGSLVPTQQMSLGFKTAGTLTEVDVKVGDVVSAGQVLAKIDTAPLQLALQQAQAAAASAQAQLTNTQNGTALQQATDQLNQANQAYTDAVNSSSATSAADQAQLSADQATLSADTTTLNNDKSAYWFTQYGLAIGTYQASLTVAQLAWQSDLCSYSVPAVGVCLTDQNNILAAQNSIACAQGTSMAGCTFPQQQMAAAFKAEAAAQLQVNADTARVTADNSRISADQAAGQRSIQAAQNSVTNAQDSYNNQAWNRPATLAQQSASVASLNAQVDTAQKNLDGAVLLSPIAGVITNVSAQAGDAVAAGGSSTGSQAPGTTALLPTSGAASSAASGGGFITVIALGTYVTVVTMAESDAAKVQSGQTGSATFDAVIGLSIPVHVVAIAASATVVSNVVNYYVTLALDGTDSRLRAGMTTNATVITARASNVLIVPNSSISRRGGLPYVNLLQGGKSIPTPVTLGVVGATFTEVKTGVKAGDKVVLPTVSSGTTTRTGGGGGGGVFRVGG